MLPAFLARRLRDPALPSVFVTARRCLALSLLVLVLAACSPALNWREVHGSDAPYVVLLPAKPSSFTRPVRLGELQVEMSMTAAEVDDVNFAVASAKIADAAQRPAALAAMQAAMLRNIGSAQHSEKAVTLKGGIPATEVVATGRAGNSAVTLHARFVMHGEYVYQAIALGPAARLSDETAETFLTSFVLR